jgi:hypothetical protein
MTALCQHCDSHIEMCEDCGMREILNGVPSAWISVKDWLPEESGYYLVCNKAGWITDMHFSAKHQLWNVHDHSRNLENKIAVTHWMPLPDAPEVE